MYPTDIYDWFNDPNDYKFDNDGYHSGDSYQGRNRTHGFYGNQHDNMNNSDQYSELTCFQKSKIRKQIVVLYSSLLDEGLKLSSEKIESDKRYFSKSIGF